MSDKESTERKDATERRVYNLPADLLERLRAYQTSQGIASEVEAARRLLDSALQMRDTVDAILSKLKTRFADERDLRVLNKDVLAAHPLITRIELDETSVTFTMRTGDAGRITTSGHIYKGDPSNEYFHEVEDAPKRRAPAASPQPVANPTWDAGKGDLDDEIPF